MIRYSRFLAISPAYRPAPSQALISPESLHLSPNTKYGPAAMDSPHRPHKYYDLLLGGFVCVLLCSNLIGPGKTVRAILPLGIPLSFGAGNLFFPISYIFDDV